MLKTGEEGKQARAQSSPTYVHKNVHNLCII